MPIPSQSPVRYPSGVSTDPPYGPLANLGLPNPLMYHLIEDDFDLLHPAYVQTKTGNGTIASAAGDGGRLLFTTNSSTPAITDLASLQTGINSFTLTAGKKLFFLTRVQVADAVNAAFRLGLLPTSATPFGATDGIFFDKATGSAANLTLVHKKAGVTTSLVIPTTSYTLANNVDLDLGFAMDRSGNIAAYVGTQLVGWLPQSERPAGQVAGPVGWLAVTQANLAAVALSPTLAVQSGTATAKTMNVDFFLAAKER